MDPETFAGHRWLTKLFRWKDTVRGEDYVSRHAELRMAPYASKLGSSLGQLWPANTDGCVFSLSL